MNPKIKFVIHTLGNRNKWVEQNKNTLSNLKVCYSIYGNKYQNTLENFFRIDVPYQTLNPSDKYFGAFHLDYNSIFSIIKLRMKLNIYVMEDDVVVNDE